MGKNIYFYIGTTAELIKLAPVIKELEKRKIKFKIIASGQNTVNFDEFKSIIHVQKPYHTIKIKWSFKIPSSNILLDFGVWIVISFFYCLSYFKKEFKGLDKKNTLLLVHGDTVSSLIGAISSKILNIRLVHIESGLRSFNFFEPFPEEFSRFIISHLADIHFCPNSWSVHNLNKISGVKINTLNNTLIETLSDILKIKRRPIVSKIISNKKFFLLVLHRQEHIFFKKNLTKTILKIFTEYANKEFICILVLHKLTKDFMKKENLLKKIRKNKNFILVPRLPYAEFMQIMKAAEFIATDGGSNQEEAYYMGKPCLILRKVTERIEGLGENAILSHTEDNLIRYFIKNYKKYNRKPAEFTTPPSKIIVDHLINYQ